MNVLRVFALVVVFCCVTSAAWSNDIELSASPGSKAGTINVSGTVTADAGWTPALIVPVSIWQDGCLLTTDNVTIMSVGCGKYTFNVDVGEGKLTSGATY